MRLATRMLATLAVVAGLLAPPSAAVADPSATLPSVASFFARANSSQAAAHADFTAEFELASTLGSSGDWMPEGGPLKDAFVELTPGLVGNAQIVPACSMAQQNSVFGCPSASQVGEGFLGLVSFGKKHFAYGDEWTPLNNLVPQRGEVAAFGFNLAIATGRIAVKLQPIGREDGRYGLIASSQNISDPLIPYIVKTTFWGVPSAPEHDQARFPCVRRDTDANGIQDDDDACPSTLPLRPFMTNPARCAAPRTAKLSVDTWNHPGYFASAESAPQEFDGCNSVPFSPTMSVAPTSNQTDSPSGLEVKLHFPHFVDNPESLESAPLRDVTVSLPEGMTINPSSADRLEACTDGQLGLGTMAPLACPDGSKIGSVEATTPVLGEPLEGGVYLRAQNSDDPASGEMFRIAMVLENAERGISVRLPGQVRVDPSSGRIVTTFADNPQLPVEDVDLQLKSGPRAPLAMPASCGRKTTEAHLTSWAGQAVDLRDSFVVPCGSSAGFTPRLLAGTTNPIGGLTAPFVLRVDREDGQQTLGTISTELPAGLTAYLKGVPYCPDSALASAASRQGKEELASPSCPAGSRIGTVRVGAGAGALPFYVTGTAYLAGPYKDAPLSLAVVTPATAGPFDLGTVVVRTALRVDPTTARITAVSDPLPQVIKGVPVRLRSVEVAVDRPQFTLNPTSCEEAKITSMISGSGGATANPQNAFQVANCEALGFEPKLSLRFSGQLKRTGDPALRAVLTQPKGSDANIAKTKVMLPKTMFIDNAHINNPCTRVQFNANQCPPKSVLGTAKAFTPLLDQPLEGPVYFRSNGGERELPDMVVDLHGQIHVILVGFIDSVKVKGTESSRLRTRFVEVPDAPVSKFVLNLYGGKRGLIENSVNLCRVGRAEKTATVKTEGQNGKSHDFNKTIAVSCPKRHGEKGRHPARR